LRRYSTVAQLRFRLLPAFSAAPKVCGFSVYARDVSTTGEGAGGGDGGVDNTAEEADQNEEKQEEGGPSLSGGVCTLVPSRLPPSPPSSPAVPSVPSPPRPPRPSRPPRPREPSSPSPPPPRAPAGPRGPPGPPGASTFVAGRGGTVSAAGGGERVEGEEGVGTDVGRPWQFAVSGCPPWLHVCWSMSRRARNRRGREVGYVENDDVFPSRPQLPPALEF